MRNNLLLAGQPGVGKSTKTRRLGILHDITEEKRDRMHALFEENIHVFLYGRGRDFR
ncbi:hypothetical protein HY633_04460 [Candidatus Uhrbacteria bacterium]|nr:hypothetical protein [Candidatus Uhrbacteria bacterium]